jgi:hypothetical protein
MHLSRPSDWKIFGVRLISSRLNKMRRASRKESGGGGRIFAVYCATAAATDETRK